MFFFSRDVFTDPHGFVIIAPGESKVVKALPNPKGLRIAIAHDVVTGSKTVKCNRWECADKAKITVTYMNGSDITIVGGNCAHMMLPLH